MLLSHTRADATIVVSMFHSMFRGWTALLFAFDLHNYMSLCDTRAHCVPENFNSCFTANSEDPPCVTLARIACLKISILVSAQIPKIRPHDTLKQGCWED